jgi:hypothetical protein
MNIDEFEAQLRRDETADQPLITPVEYGRLRGIAPQLVYYYIRNKKIDTQICPCGRRCIDKEAADEHFRSTGKLPPKNDEGPSTGDPGDAGGLAE